MCFGFASVCERCLFVLMFGVCLDLASVVVGFGLIVVFWYWFTHMTCVCFGVWDGCCFWLWWAGLLVVCGVGTVLGWRLAGLPWFGCILRCGGFLVCLVLLVFFGFGWLLRLIVLLLPDITFRMLLIWFSFIVSFVCVFAVLLLISLLFICLWWFA